MPIDVEEDIDFLSLPTASIPTSTTNGVVKYTIVQRVEHQQSADVVFAHLLNEQFYPELHPLIVGAKELTRTVWDKSGKHVDQGDEKHKGAIISASSSSSTTTAAATTTTAGWSSPFLFRRVIKEIEFTDKMLFCCGCIEKYDWRDCGLKL